MDCRVRNMDKNTVLVIAGVTIIVGLTFLASGDLRSRKASLSTMMVLKLLLIGLVSMLVVFALVR
jgi:hypothetical protein